MHCGFIQFALGSFLDLHFFSHTTAQLCFGFLLDFFLLIVMTKSDRKLRDNTRKDYTKMHSGVNGEMHDQEPGFSAHAAGKNNNNNNDGGCGEIIENEFFLSAEEVYSDVDSVEAESSDAEVSEARKELDLLRIKQKRLAKKSKLEKIEKEKEEVRRSLEKIGRGRKKNSSNVNIKSLRKMADVTEKVDKLMDKKLKLNRTRSSSGSSSESASDSGGSSESESEEEIRPKARKEKDEKGRRRSHRSGKSKSVCSRVKYPQEWPNSHLNLHFVNRKKDYEELTMSEFCAGYSTILEFSRGIERKHRTEHFTELMYLSSKFTWRTVLNYHGACLTEIERGQLKWGDSFLALKSTILAGSSLISQNGSGVNGRTQAGSGFVHGGNKSESVIFCKNFQRGTCSQTRDHYGHFYGQSRLLKHICATCWQKDEKLLSHPETADECPHKQ